jgi:predicted phosphodiesterase
MSAILTADIHLNDNARDESRWGLLDWLAEQHADELIILGDLTVAKNNHPARMVNRLVAKFMTLATVYKKIYILKGNHDYVDPNCPFFGFINHFSENIFFILMPLTLDTTIGKWVFMPAGTDWSTNVAKIKGQNVFAHATFDGAISETGFQLTGVNPNIVRDTGATVISGDVHKPQKMGTIEYVGAPYHCHFGDDYTPRLMYIDNEGNRSDLHFPSPRKFSQVIKSLDELYRIKIKAGDQIKIIVQMRRADLPDWKNWREAIREQAEKEGWLLFGPELRLQTETKTINQTNYQSHEELVEIYAMSNKASNQHVLTGKELLKSARE